MTIPPPREFGERELPAPASPGQIQSIIPLLELERRAILHALEYTKGDRAVAAHLLGIGRTTLYRKLKEYQLAS
jgi:DNA-binding NtrC family response regulator